jgi:hypothetical protein
MLTYPETCGIDNKKGWPDRSQTMAIFSGRRYSWLFIIWVLIGIVVAWERHYITVELLKLILSAILAIFLWPLVLLGVNLHIH